MPPYTPRQKRVISCLYKVNRRMTISEICTKEKMGWNTVSEAIKELDEMRKVISEIEDGQEYWMLN